MTDDRKSVVITYGTFDMFHIGHLKLLERLDQMGSKLIVAVSTDEFNKAKGKKCIIPYAQRASIVEAIKYVDLVIPEQNWDQKILDIEKYRVNTFAMGNDWEGEFDYLNEYCKVVYLDRTEGISTTSLKKTLRSFTSVSKEDLLKVFEVIDLLKKDFD